MNDLMHFESKEVILIKDQTIGTSTVIFQKKKNCRKPHLCCNKNVESSESNENYKTPFIKARLSRNIRKIKTKGAPS